jgi:hypothetical protein
MFKINAGNGSIAGNEQVFLLCWYSVICQPEPKVSKVNAVDVIFYCWDLFVKPGLQMISDGTMSFYSSSNIGENHMLGAYSTFGARLSKVI